MADSSDALMPARPGLTLDKVERVERITRAEFVERFVKPRVPAVLGNVGESWPATKRWTPQFFLEKFADREIIVVTNEKKTHSFGSGYGGRVTMKMSEYVDAVLNKEQDLRLGARNTLQFVPELLNDFTFPDLGTGYLPRLVWLFFGCKGSRTPLHYDFKTTHVLHTMFSGSKTFYLFPPSQSRALHQLPLTPRSLVDPANPDFKRFPRLREVKGYHTVLKAGDTLYMPAGMWHDTRYHDGSIALTLRFTENEPGARARIGGQLLKVLLNYLLGRVAPEAWPRWQEKHA